MAADTLSLKGKTAIVTGSGRENGIGSAIARAFARNGANVAIHYVSDGSKKRAEQVASGIRKDIPGANITIVHGPLQKIETAETIVKQAMEAFGVDHIDILVNNASTGAADSLLEAKQELIEHEFGVNVFGLIYMTRAVVGAGKMPHGGRIINIGSISSKRLIPPPIYGATKAAADALTTMFAAELGKTHGITVNTLAPGAVNTDMGKRYLENPDGSLSDVARAVIGQQRAADRLGQPDDVADAVLLMVSEKSRWITGQYIPVNGGVTGTMQ